MDYLLWGTNLVIALATLVIAIYSVKQASATKATADALINSERAWMMAEIEWHSVGLMEINSNGIDKTGVGLILICQNQGKTPGWITEKRIQLEIMDSLPWEPQLDAIDVFQNEPQPLSAGKESRVLVDCECDGRRDGPNIVVVYGVIRYRDIFGRPERQTRFGYKITPDDRLERLAGYPEYNKNT